MRLLRVQLKLCLCGMVATREGTRLRRRRVIDEMSSWIASGRARCTAPRYISWGSQGVFLPPLCAAELHHGRRWRPQSPGYRRRCWSHHRNHHMVFHNHDDSRSHVQSSDETLCKARLESRRLHSLRSFGEFLLNRDYLSQGKELTIK